MSLFTCLSRTYHIITLTHWFLLDHWLSNIKPGQYQMLTPLHCIAKTYSRHLPWLGYTSDWGLPVNLIFSWNLLRVSAALVGCLTMRKKVKYTVCFFMWDISSSLNRDTLIGQKLKLPLIKKGFSFFNREQNSYYTLNYLFAIKWKIHTVTNEAKGNQNCGENESVLLHFDLNPKARKSLEKKMYLHHKLKKRFSFL